jgi:predicted nucleic acid-binding Zn ribbon protein
VKRYNLKSYSSTEENAESECARLRDTIALQDAVLQASEKRYRATLADVRELADRWRQQEQQGSIATCARELLDLFRAKEGT